MKKVLEYRNCFVCGKESKVGLRIDVEITAKGARTFYTPGEEFEGFRGIVHGGILCALLDEIMWKAINGHTGAVTMTAKMEVRFKNPAAIGTRLSVEGLLRGQKQNFFKAQSVISDPEGNIVAEASGLFIELAAEKKAGLLEGLN